MKMEKTPRYTQRERNMVLGFAAQYKDVIENKRTDAESNRKKDEVWRQIAKEFNARVYHQRSSKQLRQLYKNMKLLLKKDLCGENKGNRSFMDLLNTLSQQESVAQYISEQMSPSGYSSGGGQQKYDDEYDDSKLPSVGGFDGMDTDVIVIKSEDISGDEQSQNGGGDMDDMDDDDDNCLSPKDIPEVCLEEEDDEIFATDLRQQTQQQQQQQSQRHQQQQQNQQPPQPEITIQNVGGIRVGSIGSLANLKALQNGNNSALSITPHTATATTTATTTVGINGGSNNNNNANNNSITLLRQSSAEQAQQHLLLNGLGLSAVHAAAVGGATTVTEQPPLPPLPPILLPTLQRAGGSSSSNNNNSSSNNGINSVAQQLLLNFNNGNSNNFGHKTHASSSSHHHHHHSNNNNNNSNHNNNTSRSHNHNYNSGSSNSNNNNSNGNDYLMSLAIEERKRKIDLLNAQIEYWKTLTRKLDANVGHQPSPACLCHFPGKLNGGLQTQTSSS